MEHGAGAIACRAAAGGEALAERAAGIQRGSTIAGRRAVRARSASARGELRAPEVQGGVIVDVGPAPPGILHEVDDERELIGGEGVREGCAWFRIVGRMQEHRAAIAAVVVLEGRGSPRRRAGSRGRAAAVVLSVREYEQLEYERNTPG